MKKILLNKIKSKIRPLLQQVSARVGKHAEKLSPARKKFVVIIFCVLFSALSICIIVKTLSSKDKRIFFMKPTVMPVHLGKNIRTVQPIISDETYQRVERFKKYLDSLSVTNTKTYEQIINERPHLTDSVMLLEKLYRSQSKKQ